MYGSVVPLQRKIHVFGRKNEAFRIDVVQVLRSLEKNSYVTFRIEHASALNSGRAVFEKRAQYTLNSQSSQRRFRVHHGQGLVKERARAYGVEAGDSNSVFVNFEQVSVPDVIKI